VTRMMAVLLVLVGIFALAAPATEVVRVALDWTPNTNHTGLLVARAEGFFAEAGLDLALVEPDPNVAVPLVAVGRAEFGIASQEYITMARAAGIPIVSVAALFPHNTSGFASPTDRGIRSPRDFAGKTYAGWGSEMEEVMIGTVMEADGSSAADVEFLDIGTIDFTTAVRLDIADFYWIFYGWEGVHAELLGIPFDFLPLPDLAPVLDYYTPVLFTSEEVIAERPELVRAFLHAAARGYVRAALDPDASAERLLDYAPELDRDLVLASQRWLASESESDVTRWGHQEEAVWTDFAAWALDHGLIDAAIDPLAAFTNAFLPTEGGGE
jgi:ABC-type nitrate/sulfonate/bicarbonate transport system substrate-binding protein